MLWHKNLFIFYCVVHLVIYIYTYILMALCWFISIYLKFPATTKPTSQMLTTMSTLISRSTYLLRELKNPNWRHGIVWELDFSWKTPKIRIYSIKPWSKETTITRIQTSMLPASCKTILAEISNQKQQKKHSTIVYIYILSKP